MEKYQYKIKYFGGHEMNDLKMDEYLNEQGSDGWELVQVIERQAIDNATRIANYRFILKRKI